MHGQNCSFYPKVFCFSSDESAASRYGKLQCCQTNKPSLKNMTSKVLIIIGMHRSATSLIAQWLQHCGLFIGKRLEGPDIGNIQGHFEDCDFLEIHQQLLKKRNYSSPGLVYTHVPEPDASEKRQLTNIIEAKSRENNEWGWKDPRTCLFLKVYRELLPS